MGLKVLLTLAILGVVGTVLVGGFWVIDPFRPIVASAPVIYPTYTPAPTPASSPVIVKATVVLDGGRLFNEVNAYRSKNGLSQLSWYHPLCEYAKVRSNTASSDWSHDGYISDSKTTLYTEVCPLCGKTGENLARGYETEAIALKAWIGSPGHKANLDGDWDWGCAMYYGNDVTAMLFGKKR